MERRHPTDSKSSNKKGGKNENDKNVDKITRPEKEDIY